MLALKKKLYCLLVILDEWKMKQCRQWGWSQKVLDGVRSMQRASRDAATLLAGVEEAEGKKRVLVGTSLEAMNSTHNRSLCATGHHVLTFSQEKDCRSYEFQEK